MVTIFLSDEAAFSFHDDCSASSFNADKRQLPAACAGNGGVCDAAYCAQFTADGPDGYDPDAAHVASNVGATIQWRDPAAAQ